MAQSGEPELYSFANNFWGKDGTGVNTLLNHINQVKHTADDIRNFYKERIAIEEEYSRKLIALSRKGLGIHEIGTLKDALETIRINTEGLSKNHASAAAQFRSELDEPLAAFLSGLRTRRKALQSSIEKLFKLKTQQEVNADKLREKYEFECNKINSYYAQQNLLMGRELEKNNQKLDKALVSIESTKRDYQNALRLLAETTERWNKEWKLACDKFQDLEEERVNFLKSNLWAYTNIVSTVCVNDDEGCENIRVSLEKTDVFVDNDLFVKTHGSGNEIYDPPEFVNYLNGVNSDSLERKFTYANFPRISEANETPEMFDPTASLSASTRYAQSIQPSVANSRLSEIAETQTVVINRNTRDSIASNNNRLSNQFGNQSRAQSQAQAQAHAHAQAQAQAQQQKLAQQQQQQQQQKLQQLKQLQQEYEDSLEGIPVLSPPTQEFPDSQRNSPVQRIMSRQTSMESNPTSISEQSDQEAESREYETKSPYSNVPNDDFSNKPMLVLPSDKRPGSRQQQREQQQQQQQVPDIDVQSHYDNQPSQQEEEYHQQQASAQAGPSRNNNDYYSQNQPQQQQQQFSMPVINPPEPTPTISEPAQEKQEEQPQPKKRTWASPFRRRSKKDLNKGWSANTTPTKKTTTAPVEPLGTPRAPFSGNNNSASAPTTGTNTPTNSRSRAGSTLEGLQKPSIASFKVNNNQQQQGDARLKDSSSSSRPATVLSMGDNMFDLGVNPSNRSPFESRSKAPSPTKSFAKDDPLVQALEQLKIAGGAMNSNNNANSANTSAFATPSGSPIKSTPGNSTFNKPPPLMNPDLRHQRSGSALVPPQAAFTSTEMQAASAKYANQTKEMFGNDDVSRQRSSASNRYNGNNMGGGSAPPPRERRSASPQPGYSQQFSNSPQQGHQPQQRMQRPRTMYENDFSQSSMMHQPPGQIGNGHHRSMSANPPDERGNDRYSTASDMGAMDYNRYGSNNNAYRNGSRGVSPNPGMNNGGYNNANNMPMNPNDLGRSASPNPMAAGGMMRSASPNPMAGGMMRSASPNPMTGGNMMRSASPNPMAGGNMMRSASPNPMAGGMMRSASPNPMTGGNMMRSASPNPMSMQGNNMMMGNNNNGNNYRRSASPNPQPDEFDRYGNRMMQQPSQLPPQQQQFMGHHHRNSSTGPSRSQTNNRSVSPAPYHTPQQQQQQHPRSVSPNPMMMNNNGYMRNNSMSAPNANFMGGVNPAVNNGGYMSNNGSSTMIPQPQQPAPAVGGGMMNSNNTNLPVIAKDGRRVIKYCKASFDYRAAIAEELGFRKGEIMLVVDMLDDGWWEAQCLNDGRMGLVPGNFMAPL